MPFLSVFSESQLILLAKKVDGYERARENQNLPEYLGKLYAEYFEMFPEEDEDLHSRIRKVSS